MRVRGQLLGLLQSNNRFIRTQHQQPVNTPTCASLYHVHQPDKWPTDLLSKLKSSFRVLDNFVSESEEKMLFAEVEQPLRRLRYEKEHWDDAIHNYREVERTKWSEPTEQVFNRMRSEAFTPEQALHSHVHVLDLHKDGHIKPHVDSTRYCGSVIVGLSLLSPAVMRLVHCEHKHLVCDLLLKARSLYVLRIDRYKLHRPIISQFPSSGTSRFDYTHEVLGNTQSVFNQTIIPRDRRISIMCRDLP